VSNWKGVGLQCKAEAMVNRWVRSEPMTLLAKILAKESMRTMMDSQIADRVRSIDYEMTAFKYSEAKRNLISARETIMNLDRTRFVFRVLSRCMAIFIVFVLWTTARATQPIIIISRTMAKMIVTFTARARCWGK
jgi:hypothetical protein